MALGPFDIYLNDISIHFVPNLSMILKIMWRLGPSGYATCFQVLYRVGDKLGQDYFLKQFPFSTPSELLTSLEDTLSHKEALIVMKHVLGSMQYHEEFSKRSFVKIFEDYERELDHVNIYHDDEFLGRQSDIETLYNISSVSKNQGWYWNHYYFKRFHDEVFYLFETKYFLYLIISRSTLPLLSHVYKENIKIKLILVTLIWKKKYA